LFDQPQVIASADEALISTELRRRCQLIAGSFFETVPAGGDVYIMKVILHDWDDRTSICFELPNETDTHAPFGRKIHRIAGSSLCHWVVN
jgi:hypothetical protein